MDTTKQKFILFYLIYIVLAQDGCYDTKLDLMQTGEILLNFNDMGTAGVNKHYYESLSRGNFRKFDYLGYAFALAGFETTCSQLYYSLFVDIVEFEQNTRMKIIVSFVSKSYSFITIWTKVKFSYIVVSSARRIVGHSQSQIWALSEMVDLSGGDVSQAPVFKNDVFTATTGCGLYWNSVSSKYIFGIQCGATSTFTNKDIAVHAYIMGFQYQNNLFLASLLSASIDWDIANAAPANGGGMLFDDEKQLLFADTTTRFQIINQQYGVAYGTTAVSGAQGPIFQLISYSKELKTIKIGLVLTMINPGFGNTVKRNGYDASGSFSYSGLHTPVAASNYNIKTMIDNDSTKNWNNLYQKLPSPKYKIYGFSSFQLAQSSKCTSFNLQLNIESSSAYTVKLNNMAFVTNVIIQADIYFPLMSGTCSAVTKFTNLIFDYNLGASGSGRVPPFKGDYSTDLKNARNDLTPDLKLLKKRLSQKYLVRPSNQFYQSINQVTLSANPLDLQFVIKGMDNNKENVRLNAEIVIGGIKSGAPYGIRILMIPDSTRTDFPNTFDAGASPDLKYEFKVKVNQQSLYSHSFLNTDLNLLDPQTADLTGKKSEEFYGINLNASNATFSYELIIPRSNNSGVVYTFTVEVQIYEIVLAFDPVSQCCTTSCPSKTALDITVTPPTCISCEQSRGFVYDPVSLACKCVDGYYLDSSLGDQCFPCPLKFCKTCTVSPSVTGVCTECMTGAVLNSIDNSCSCKNGYFQTNGKCTQCPSRCSQCKTNSTCDTCGDVNRIFDKDCSCPLGFYDPGTEKCQSCNQNCAACTNSSICLSCDARKFRKLSKGICLCQDNSFQLTYQNGTKQCIQCSFECKTCIQGPQKCLTCDSAKNRIMGYDNLGHQTCVCKPGYHSMIDGSCVLSNCNFDIYCSKCQGLGICTQCRTTLNRVIDLRQNRCVCVDGFYENPETKNCTSCSNGCALCSSNQICTSCVPNALMNKDGTCTCINSTFFSVSSVGVPYCQGCSPNCQKCSNLSACSQCVDGYTLASDNTCICPLKNYINQKKQCFPCQQGCQLCSSNLICSKCVSPLVLQQKNCIAQCSQGRFLSGVICLKCSSSCQACTAEKECFFCKDNFYLLSGTCYQFCPQGTLANKNTSKCIPCNLPCRTCTDHPSFCTSCIEGQGFLQIRENQQKCVLQCSEGTFPKNNVCQVCDFKCAQCLGSSSFCVACPEEKYLYNGVCWDYCPAILINNTCSNNCVAGYFKLSENQCKACKKQCQTCQNETHCLTCSSNYLSRNGKCVSSCDDGFYSSRGFCVSCDNSCKSCKNIPTQCIECSLGYVSSGPKCVSQCQQGTYLDIFGKKCLACQSLCNTCVSQNHCTSCQNLSILVDGKCLKCQYPCSSCSASNSSVCTSCLSGFSLLNEKCVINCPDGMQSRNGVCACINGVLTNGICTTKCPVGFTKIGINCQKCQFPCTDCNGSTKFCTNCLDYFTLNSKIGACERVSSCNYGQIELYGKCERICKQEMFYQNGSCLFGGCIDPYSDNGFGGCIFLSASSSPNKCLTPQFKLGNICVENCGSKYYPNSKTRNCELCPVNCESCLNSNYCLTCRRGFSTSNGKCDQNSNCSINQLQYDGTCVRFCPNGSFMWNGKCIRSCPQKTYYFGGLCFSTCPPEAKYFTKIACISSCTGQTTLVDQQCRLK